MKLITEQIDNVEFITEESKDGKKTMFIEGVFLQGNIQNRNGRVYKTSTLCNEVARYQREHIDRNRAVGELGHPDGPTINMDKISHQIVSLRQEGNNFIGRAKLLDTPNGKIAQTLATEGILYGVSSRGLGSLTPTKEGYSVVGEDFMLATAADLVMDPSAPDAFVQGIMEGKEWVIEGGIVKESHLKGIQSTIDKAVSSRELEEHTLNLFAKFWQNL